MHVYEQLVQLLNLENLQFPVNEARQWLHCTCLDTLKASSHANKGGFRISERSLFEIPTVQNEIDWLLQRLFCSGLDKANNNACFICIRHIRLLALERLSGDDFKPCKNDSS